MDFKKTLTFVISTIVVLSIVNPGSAFAVTTTSTEVGFCGNVTVLKAKADQKIVDNVTKLQKKWTDRTVQVTANRAKRDAELNTNRAKWDQNRVSEFTKLEARAKTASSAIAVKTFESQITAAIAIRRSALDSAISKFRSSFDQIIVSRQVAINTAVNTFIASVDSAFAKASSDCASGVVAKTVRENTVASLKADRETFKTSREGLTKFETQIEPLETVRKAAIQKAIDDFKTTVQQDRDQLKAALSK